MLFFHKTFEDRIMNVETFDISRLYNVNCKMPRIPAVGGELSTKILSDVSCTHTLAPLHAMTATKYSPPS